jgi:hypothetical protein
MKVTLDVDEALMARAKELAGIRDGSVLVRLGLESLVARLSARRLAELGGSEPWASASRRRTPARSTDWTKNNAKSVII